MQTVVVNMRRDDWDVRIDRRSKWGNPYVLGEDGDRAEVCQKYRERLLDRIDLLESLEELRGLRLGCWCKPLQCHGDTLERSESVDPWRISRQASGHPL
jgi:hypothetical protein